MKTSTKIFIGVGVVFALYLVWEVYCVVSENTTDDDENPYDTPTAGTEDYDAYIAGIEASAGTGDSGSSGGSNSSGGKSSFWSTVAAFFLGPSAIDFSSIASSQSGSGNSTWISSADANFSASEFPIQWGSEGTAVKQLQKWLNTFVYNSKTIVEDGIYGQKTNNAMDRLDTMINADASLKKYKSTLYTKSNGRYTITESQFKNIYNTLVAIGKN